ncbi:MAG: MIP family channel protein [Lachnospiraceae bacterium]|nr:MIP family channel protein [Lachnospiraceae bacterium]
MKKYVAEFIGTCVLTLFGCGAAAVSGGVEGELGILGIALAFGLAVVAMAFAIGDISGCHINPAVSLGVFVAGGMSVGDLIGYIISQFLGGAAGAGLLYIIEIMTESVEPSSNGLGANGFGDFSYVGINLGGALLVEIVLTFVFVLVVLAVISKAENSIIGGVVIGLTLTFVHIFGIPLTGTSVNPARSLGPALFSGVDYIAQVWVFIVGPLVGAALAAVIFKLLYSGESEE